MKRHARLAPSDAARWLNCPAAIVFDDRYPGALEKFSVGEVLEQWQAGTFDMSTLRPAQKGTLAHAFAEQYILLGPKADEPLDRLLEEIGYLGNALAYADAVNEFLSQGQPWDTWELEREVQLWYEPGSYGTIDFTARRGARIYVVDYKSGVMPVDVGESAQLAIYGIALRKELELFDRIDTVEVGICQPAVDDEICWQTYERGQLDALEKLVTDTAAMLALPGLQPYPRVTPAGCAWCRHKARCPAQEAQARAALDLPGVELLTPEQLAEIQTHAKATRKYLDAVEEYVRENLDQFPMFALGEPKVTRYDWLDTEKTVEALKSFGVEPWREPELISFSEAKRLVPKASREALLPLAEAVRAGKRPLVPVSEVAPAAESTESAYEKLT